MLFSLSKERVNINNIALKVIFLFVAIGIIACLYFFFPQKDWLEDIIAIAALLLFFLIIYNFASGYFNNGLNSNPLLVQSELLNTLILGDHAFYIILDNNQNVILASENIKVILSEYHDNLQLDTFNRIMHGLQLRSAVSKQLSTSYNHKEDARIKTSIMMNNIPTAVILKLYFIEIQLEKYAIIQGIKDDPYAIIEDIYDKFNFGYFELDEFYHIIKCNDFFARSLGYSRNELLENYFDIKELLTSEQLHNNKRETIDNNWQGFLVFKTKQQESLNTIVITKAYYSQFGTIERIAGYMMKLLDHSLIMKAKGLEEGWLEYSWQCFFANSSYPVIIIDLFDKIIKMNAAASELVNNNSSQFSNIFIDEDAKKVQHEMQKWVANPNIGIPPLNALHMVGNDRIVDVHLGRIMNLGEQHYGFMVRFYDVTEKLELEKQLSHNQRMQTIGNLAGSIAHDFNNLLTAILGFCDLLLLRHTPGDSSFADIMQIRQSTNRASSLVGRLLAFSRRQTLKGESLNLNEFFGDFYAIIRRLVGGDIALEQYIPPDLWYIKVDVVQFEQVILNLVVNAHQALNNSGKLIVKAYNLELNSNNSNLAGFILPKGEQHAEMGKYIAIEIEDNGKGIPLEIIDRIFEPFFTTKNALSGTGLGLSTVYGIIKQSGGYIYLKTQIDIGTTFLLLFPRYIPSQQELEALKAPVEEQSRSDYQAEDKSGTIVLVEDEEAVRTFAKQALINKGYEVLDFESPLLALEYLEQHQEPIKLIISDVVMPQMSGPSFVEKLNEQYKELKVIFISGYGEEVFTKTYGDVREFNFLPKPFSLKSLIAKVKEVCK